MSNDNNPKSQRSWGHPHVSEHEKAIAEHLIRINKEFKDGFDLIQKYPRSVSIFGSSMITADTKYYKDAMILSEKIAKELNYAVVNGGGPGIMEASCLGTEKGGGTAVGLRINHVREHTVDTAATTSANFSYFFVRKALLAFAAEAYIFFPGGFGTFDELYSILTLIQTEKIPKVPVILFESDFWNPLMKYMTEHMNSTNHLIERHDLDLCEVTDDPARVIEIIRKSPTSEWWRNLN